jgi:hypothetical protein
MNSEMNEQSLNFRARVIISGNDSVSMTIFGPFGLTLGKLFSDSKSFQFFNTMENAIYKGSPTQENIKKATNLSISIQDFLRLFQGKTAYQGSDYKLFSDKSDGKLIYTRVDKNNFADFVVVSAIDPKIIQYQRKDKGDVLILNSSYDLYKNTDGIAIPTSINFAMPTVGGKLVIEIENYKLNSEAALPEKFTLPSSAKIIDLDK